MKAIKADLRRNSICVLCLPLSHLDLDFWTMNHI